MITTETQRILDDGFGFRNCSAYGINEPFRRSFEKIFKYEVNELENESMIVDFQEKFNLPHTKKDPINEIGHFVNNYFNVDDSNLVYGFWLATKETVEEIYYGKEELSKFYLPKKFLLVTDYPDGALFASNTPLDELKRIDII